MRIKLKQDKLETEIEDEVEDEVMLDPVEEPREAPVFEAGFDPLDEAERLGISHFGDVGFAMRWLEMSFLLQASGHAFFTGSRARSRMNILLYWGRGGLKSTILETFIQECMTGFNLDNPGDPLGLPCYNRLVDATVQALQGSVGDGGKVMLPAILGATIVVMTEMTSILGTSKEEADTIGNFFNVALEEGTMKVNRVKLVGMPPATEEFYRQNGITYNPVRGSISYPASLALWAATRPIDKALEQRLRDSGYIDRLMWLRYDPPDTPEGNRQWRAQMRRKPRQQDYSRLRAWNDALWRCEFNRFQEPPEDMIDRCMDLVVQCYDALEDDPSSRVGRARSGRSNRDIVNVMQMLAAHAILETVKAGHGPEYTELVYNTVCEERTMRLIPGYVRSRSPTKGW